MDDAADERVLVHQSLLVLRWTALDLVVTDDQGILSHSENGDFACLAVALVEHLQFAILQKAVLFALHEVLRPDGLEIDATCLGV